MAAEPPKARAGFPVLWTLGAVILLVAGVLFAPVIPCDVCLGEGTVNHGAWQCPCCLGSKRLGYGMKRWREWRLTQPMGGSTWP